MLPNSLTLEAGIQQALGVRPPWSVQKAELEPSRQRLRIDLRHAGTVTCPICGASAKRHDARRRAVGQVQDAARALPVGLAAADRQPAAAVGFDLKIAQLQTA